MKRSNDAWVRGTKAVWQGCRALALATGVTALGVGGCADDRPPPLPAAKLGPAQFDATLPTREVFFGNPEKVAPKLSADGKHLLFIAPVDGVLNVWAGPANDISKAQAITSDKLRGIRGANFAYDNNTVLYVQDTGGDENWQLYATDLKTKKTRALAGGPKVTVRIAGISEKKKDKIVVGLNDRDEAVHDLWTIELTSGKKTLLEKNEQGFESYVLDHDLNVRLAKKMREDGSIEVLEKIGKTWSPFAVIPFEDADTTGYLGFDDKGTTLYSLESSERDTSALFATEMKSKKKTLLAESAKADRDDVIEDPKTHKPQAAAFNYDRVTWTFLDKTLEADFAVLKGQVGEGDIDLISRTLDDKTWLVAVSSDVNPAKYWSFDKAKKKATLLFAARPKLDGVPMAKMDPVEIKSRDGLTLMTYVTVPEVYRKDPLPPPNSLPVVLLVHGGPWARDVWGYNSQHQWLASRGYVVMSVNFRGSTGFGKKFLNAGNKEWAAKMHDDLLDAVKWAIDEKLADPKKVAIMGGSYGGYATLAGLTFTPETFACGVDIVGPSNLRTLLSTIPAYWKPMQQRFALRMGDLATEEGQKWLDERSPLHKADKIQKPLLIGQGANDPRVKQAEADQIVKAMTDKRLPVTYVLYPDEGHGFARPANRLSFYAVAETFLSQCLNMKAQPIGEDLKGSTITVPTGAEVIEGLPAALAANAPPASLPASAPASAPAQ